MRCSNGGSPSNRSNDCRSDSMNESPTTRGRCSIYDIPCVEEKHQIAVKPKFSEAEMLESLAFLWDKESAKKEANNEQLTRSICNTAEKSDNGNAWTQPPTGRQRPSDGKRGMSTSA